jgi:hypothetical protein
MDDLLLKIKETLLDQIDSESETFTNLEGDEYECITIENLKGIINRII